MKKRILVILVILLAVTGCSSLIVVDPANYVGPETVIELFENEDTFAFVVGDSTCSACNAYMKGAQKELFEKDEVALLYIDLNTLKDVDIESFTKLVQEHLSGNFEATPTTYFVVDGNVSQVKVGSIEYEELSSTYDKFIK